MSLSVWLSYVAAAVTAVVSLFVLYQHPKPFVQRIFATGMGLFSLEALFTGLTLQTVSHERFLYWHKLELIIASLLPSVWLLFSISFGRANHTELISRWKWIILLSFLLPLSTITFFSNAFHAGNPILTKEMEVFWPIGWSGYVWYLVFILMAVLILMNLERTLRHSIGHMRWQIKFIMLGIGGIFGIRIFIDSQAILFRGTNINIAVVSMCALLLANILIIRSFSRGQPMNINIQLSHKFLYNSFTLIIVGTYFVFVSLIAWFSLHIEAIRNFHLVIFLVFISVLGLAALLLSDRLRIKRKRFISHNFKRPLYDYQKIWEDFTEKTACITQIAVLCNAIVKMISETLEILSVSIWLVDENETKLNFGGSTVFSDVQTKNLKFFSEGSANLIRAMTDQDTTVDLYSRKDDWIEDLLNAYADETKEARIRYCAPLRTTGRLIGIITLSEKVFYEPLTFEESELIKTISDQAAAALLNIRLSERLRQAKELEAFQSMAAFFMHDLKNLASKLSLVTQNLPVYLDNAEFRSDALRTISQSVFKINTMSSRLSLLSQKLELTFKETDLNDLIVATISDLKEYIKEPVSQNLDILPPIPLDREHIYKVLENLLMNAYDALGSAGKITVATKSQDNWAVISVSDNGCGMSKEFIEKSLFRPFQTTKKQGMGIGLYHCKTIVEAHNGRIDVESDEGKGTTFSVFLPLKR